jgi:hypothetical protein
MKWSGRRSSENLKTEEECPLEEKQLLEVELLG